jgi:hypothetical protein
MTIRITPGAVLAMGLASAAFASGPLDGEAVRALVGGKRVLLKTPYGVELPLRYGADGSVEGDVSGIALASMFAPRETGRWWIDGNQLCQQWPSWYDGKALCFTVTQTGERSIAWVRQDGLSGTARIAD